MAEKQDQPAVPNSIDRRQFVSNLMLAAGGSALLLVPGAGIAANRTAKPAPLTIQQVMDLILKRIPGAPFAQTVDTIKAGDPAQPVKGIVTTMFATAAVIEEAARMGANFIIAHEPTFYNHADDTAWLEGDAVYQYKKNLLQKHGMVVWRFHDYIHAHRPDGVLMGVLTALGWQQYYNPENPAVVMVPPTTLQNIISLVKKKLGIPHVKVIGTLTDTCRKIVLIPGAAGGRTQIAALEKEKPDLLIVGELNEWETSEYVRDQRHAGAKSNLLVLGHVVSEEPGLEWLAKWLQPQLPGVPVKHIPSTDAFNWV
jgi:putative NIF3 family GTP cyclohydrolase 1 type 2